MGLPLEHGVRTALLAVRLAERLALDEAAREAVYYVSLLRYAGCAS
jgi:HD-GYP domain-containing protein (c-di-GMP phosphodiesterase class II)